MADSDREVGNALHVGAGSHVPRLDRVRESAQNIALLSQQFRGFDCGAGAIRDKLNQPFFFFIEYANEQSVLEVYNPKSRVSASNRNT